MILQQNLAFVLVGNAGSRLLNILGIPVSHDTLIRLMQKSSKPELLVLWLDDMANIGIDILTSVRHKKH